MTVIYEPRGTWSWTDSTPRTATVHEMDSAPVKTGLLDALGRPIYRIPQRVPLGFHHHPTTKDHAP